MYFCHNSTNKGRRKYIMASTLTATAVLKAPPKSKTYTLSDSNGLYLQVTRSGTKSWIFRYVFDNKQKKKSLG